MRLLTIAIIIVAAIIVGSAAILERKLWLFDNKVNNPIIEKSGQIQIDGLRGENPPSFFAPEHLIWIEMASSAPWEPRDSGASFIYKNKLWITGGLNASDVQNDNLVQYWKAEHFNDIWNTEDGVHWRLVTTAAPWPPRRSMSVESFRDQLWMLGGWSPVTGYTNDIWVSANGVRWTKAVNHASFPATEGQSLIVFKNKLWKIGGVNYSQRQVKNDVWYSENGTDWIEVKNIPWKPRWDHAVAVFNGKLFLTGGMNLAGEIFNDVWVSEDGFRWLLMTNNAPWAPRQGHAMHVYKGKLWIIGRLNDAENRGANDVWFSDDGVTWQKTINDPPWTGREDFFSAVFADKIWVFGGMDANWQWRNDIWASEIIKP